MLKAYEVMTRALATCAPDASVAHAAAMMRDRDIGTVLVVEDAKLRGIVTDRDLALQALTGEDDPLQTPIRKFMTSQVVTGEAAWSLEEVMLKTYEVMTHELATCAPDESVANVAAIMRDRDIGNVLVVEDGKLRGIVTDRDLALQALTGKDDPLQTPIRKFMSTQVVTGEAAWSLEQVAKIMAQHQVRRLPIVQGGQLVGIVSLGDVALHEDRKGVAAKSLQAISTPIGISASGQPGRGGALIGLEMACSDFATTSFRSSFRATSPSEMMPTNSPS